MRLSAGLTLFLLVLVSTVPGNLIGAVVEVQPGGQVPTLAEALEIASTGDTINVQPGTYREHSLVISKSVVLLGEGWPVLDAANQGPLIEITAPDVTISGFVFRNVPVSFVKEHAALRFSYTRNCEIRNNRFENNFFALYFARSERCRIIGNTISGPGGDLASAGNGLHFWYCREIAIRDNTVIGHRDGIYLEFVKQSVIAANRSEKNLRYGLHFMFSDSCRYERNQFIRNGSGVAVMYTKHVEMEDNQFIDSWGAASFGLLLKDIRDSHVARNVFTGNSTAIHIEGSDRVNVLSNRFENNGWAVKIMANCLNSVFRENDFLNNSFQVATNSRHSFSSFDRNYWSNYRGYDLDRDGLGDEPFRPVSLYSLLVESDPATLVLVRSLLVDVLDLAERIVPTLTPEALVDSHPRMRPQT